LYRVVEFPERWEAVPYRTGLWPVDVTPFFHDELWWLFYSPATSTAEKVGRLHVAFAEPVNRGRGDASRHSGAGRSSECPDCSQAYGVIRPHFFDWLDTERVETCVGEAILILTEFAP